MLPFFEIYPSSAFGGQFCHFGLYFMLLSQEEIDVLPMIELRSFAVFANFKLQPLFYNLILKFLSPRTRTFQTKNVDVEARGRGRWHSIATVPEWARTETTTSGLPGDVDLVPVTGMESFRPRTSSYTVEAWCEVKILKLNCKIKVAI